MESNITPNPQYTQVTVDVPEDRLAEFHAFFARFLAGEAGRRRGGRHGRHGHGHHGHRGRGCRRGPERAEESRAGHRSDRDLMADKQVTVAVPEQRVPEFYAWFAAFLASEPGTPPPSGGRGRRGPRGSRRHHDAKAWSADDADQAAWLYRKLAPPARELFDLLADSPGTRIAGEQRRPAPRDRQGVARDRRDPRVAGPVLAPSGTGAADRDRRSLRRRHRLLHGPGDRAACSPPPGTGKPRRPAAAGRRRRRDR